MNNDEINSTFKDLNVPEINKVLKPEDFDGIKSCFALLGNSFEKQIEKLMITAGNEEEKKYLRNLLFVGRVLYGDGKGFSLPEISDEIIGLAEMPFPFPVTKKGKSAQRLLINNESQIFNY